MATKVFRACENVRTLSDIRAREASGLTTMHDHVCTPFEWVLQGWRCKRRIHQEVPSGRMDFVSVVLDVAAPVSVTCDTFYLQHTHRASPVGFSGVSSQQRSPGWNSSSIPMIGKFPLRLRLNTSMVAWHPW